MTCHRSHSLQHGKDKGTHRSSKADVCRPSQIRQWLQENSHSPTPAHIYCQRIRQEVYNNWNSGKQAWTRTQVHFANTNSEEDGKRNKKISKAHCHRIARNGSILGSQSLQNNHQALSTCQLQIMHANAWSSLSGT